MVTHTAMIAVTAVSAETLWLPCILRCILHICLELMMGGIRGRPVTLPPSSPPKVSKCWSQVVLPAADAFCLHTVVLKADQKVASSSSAVFALQR